MVPEAKQEENAEIVTVDTEKKINPYENYLPGYQEKKEDQTMEPPQRRDYHATHQSKSYYHGGYNRGDNRKEHYHHGYRGYGRDDRERRSDRETHDYLQRDRTPSRRDDEYIKWFYLSKS